MPVKTSSRQKLRDLIMETLRKTGYRIAGDRISLPKHATKDDYRHVNRLAVAKRLSVSGPSLERHEDRLLQYIANGSEVLPQEIRPRLELVLPRTDNELLFRYACLHWSIPVSSGYGRRLRFLVFDESNGKLIGLFGLGDPVYALGARDEWIGWKSDAKKAHLYHVMDAYVLGAVPPYSTLLCGKLVAMLACSNEVRTAFRRKYLDHRSLIKKERRQPYLALLTTTSALGRSSIYNRIRVDGYSYWRSIGYTKGSGEFHFSNGVYSSIRAYVEKHCTPTAKHTAWGDGFRNRREVVRKCLSSLGLSADLIYHGIRREIFAAPLGREALRFLRGEVERPCFYNWTASMVADKCLSRWICPRAFRTDEYRAFSRQTYRLKTYHGGQP